MKSQFAYLIFFFRPLFFCKWCVRSVMYDLLYIFFWSSSSHFFFGRIYALIANIRKRRQIQFLKYVYTIYSPMFYSTIVYTSHRATTFSSF